MSVRMCNGRHFVPRTITPLAVWHSIQLLRMQVCSCTLRIRMPVADPVIHRRQASRVEIAEPRDLHGSRMASKNRKSVAIGMAGEIHEDIDLVGAKELGRTPIIDIRNSRPT